MNWGELKAAVVEYSNRGDLTPALLTTMLGIAEQRIYNGTSIGGREVQGLRLMSMLTTVGAQPVGTLPTNFLGAHRVARLDGTRPTVLEYRGPVSFARIEGLGTPADYYTIRGNSLVVAGTETTTVQLLYFAKPARPTIDADMNVVMSAADSVYLYGLLLEVANWLRDSERMAQYAGLFMDAMISTQKADEDKTTDGGPLVITSQMVVRV